jgi:threonine/homoserine/homoserine lactone efflux protein
MASDTISPVAAALGVGLALASAPGPVQAVLVTEAVRGGVTRGLRAWVGAAGTFGMLLLALALGLSFAAPGDAAVRILKVVGGLLLVWLAVDGLRSARDFGPEDAASPGLHPTARGSLAIVLNPGAWLFLAAVASPLVASATRSGGRRTALATALALLIGVSSGDIALVLLAGLGLRKTRPAVVRVVQRALAVLLAGLGVWLIVQGIA